MLKVRLTELYELSRLCWSLRPISIPSQDLAEDYYSIQKEIQDIKARLSVLESIEIHEIGVSIDNKGKFF